MPEQPPLDDFPTVLHTDDGTELHLLDTALECDFQTPDNRVGILAFVYVKNPPRDKDERRRLVIAATCELAHETQRNLT